MEQKAAEILTSPAFIIIFFLVAGLGSLIPAMLTKVVMNAVFGHRTSFGLILIMMVLTAFAAIGIMFWLGITSEDAVQELGPEPTALLTFAIYAIQLALLSAFVPDQNLESVAMWKWAVSLILQYVLFIVIVIALVMLYYFVAATNVQAAPVQGVV